MFELIQSNDTDVLVDRLIEFYNNQKGVHSVFEDFTVIVPSVVMGDWLSKTIATKTGISTLLTTQFWSQYQWKIIKNVLDNDTHSDLQISVPDVATLSASAIRWRLFEFLSASLQQAKEILDDDEHVLHFLFATLIDRQGKESTSVGEQRMWQVCEELARVYVRYMTYRPQWLEIWSSDKPKIDIADIIALKDKISSAYGAEPTPAWLCEHYEKLEALLAFLWHQLFAQLYLDREQLQQTFWQIINGELGEQAQAQALRHLPKTLYLFTVQSLPYTELNFLKNLGLYIDVVLLHFNPSKLFWADIVDKQWLETQKIINPNQVYLKDYGHALLSRLGKESRETFAMLADMSGGEFYYDYDNNQNKQSQSNYNEYKVQWQDAFVNQATDSSATLLNQLKQDILNLSEDDSLQQNLTHTLLSTLQDKRHEFSKLSLQTTRHALPSLSVHACHNLKRQLEIARVIIARYLNEADHRNLSDVVVLLPDVSEARSIIHSVFPDTKGSDGLYLPIKITGITDSRIDELLQAITGFYSLLGDEYSRFESVEVFEWLMLPSLHESLGLDFEQASRACDLLTEAGFKRGFDEHHLAKTLENTDTDYRYSFSYAVDRITLGFLMPDHEQASQLLYQYYDDDTFQEATLPLKGVHLSDEPIINALCVIYTAINSLRDCYQKVDDAVTQLNNIENQVIDVYFKDLKDTTQMRAIFEAKNNMVSELLANKNKKMINGIDLTDAPNICLSQKFILDSLSKAVSMQAVSAEPSGAITFARFGTLRNIPFGLTIMLDMDLSKFPRQDHNMRLDLMRAGAKRRGDRFNEDDDNGAFLDAILCTKDNCAIFYNGIASDGQTKLLPSSCVSELVEFFKSQVQWQIDDTTDTDGIVQSLPYLIEEYLVTYHTPTAFDQGNFQSSVDLHNSNDSDSLVRQLADKITAQKQAWLSTLPPAPIWAQVRQTLDNIQPKRRQIITLACDEQLDDIVDTLQDLQAPRVNQLLERYAIQPVQRMPLSQLIRQLQKPAYTYLRDKITVMNYQEEADSNEPLALDGLSSWQLNDLLLDLLQKGEFDQQDDDALSYEAVLRQMYDGYLPAGVSRRPALQRAFNDVLQQFDDFIQALKSHGIHASSQDHPSTIITPVAETSIDIELGSSAMQLFANIPSPDAKHWCTILPSKASPKHLLKCWLHFLCWQSIRQYDNACMYVFFGREAPNERLVILQPVHKLDAKIQLTQWILLAFIMQKIPLALTTNNGMHVASGKHSKYKAWIDTHHASTNEDCYMHETWQAILGGDYHTAMFMLAQITKLGQLMYQPIVQQFLPPNNQSSE